MENWIVPLLSAFLGGAFTLVGQMFSHGLGKKAEARRQSGEMRNLLTSYLIEIETVADHYQGNVGKIFTTDTSKGLNFEFVARQDYLTVFNNNAHQIGKIENDAVRKTILKTYIITKSLLDTFEVNNIKRREMIALQREVMLTTGESRTKLEGLLSEKQNELAAYVSIVLNIHNAYLSTVKDCISLIQEEIRR